MSDKNDLLIPNKYPQDDMFICEIKDASFKDIIQELEHPFYTLSKKPDKLKREYSHNGNTVTITPSIDGLPTIYDKDVLVFTISVLMAKKLAGEKISKKVDFSGKDYLMFTNRNTSKRDYDSLSKSLERLRGVGIKTNIVTGGKPTEKVFGLIESGEMVYKKDPKKPNNKGRLDHVSVVLSDWVFNAISTDEVLTLHKDYFRLRKPIEKRLYEIFRKHCGKQDFVWEIGIEKLLKKVGSSMPLKLFRFNLKKISESQHLPEYSFSFENDKIYVSRDRNTDETPYSTFDSDLPHPSPSAFEEAKQIFPGEDIYHYLDQWHKLIMSEKDGHKKVYSPDKAFIKFCEYRKLTS